VTPGTAAADVPTALVTGGTDGIGRAVASRLAVSGFRVLVVGRNFSRGTAQVDAMRAAQASATQPVADHGFLGADLSLLAETAGLADRVRDHTGRLDALVCCAGNFALRPEWTNEGLERSLVLNYLSRFLLAMRLGPLLAQASSGRLVLVANAGTYPDTLNFEDLQYRRGRPGLRVASRTQFANDLLAVELAERWRDTAVAVTCVFPGVVRDDLFRHAIGLPRLLAALLGGLAGRFGVPPEVAADTPAWLASAPEAAELTGSFYGPRRQPRPVPDRARRQDRRTLLWNASEDLTAKWLRQ